MQASDRLYPNRVAISLGKNPLCKVAAEPPSADGAPHLMPSRRQSRAGITIYPFEVLPSLESSR